MSIEFNDESNSPSLLYAKLQPSNEEPRMVRWLLSSGVVKTPGQANVILITLVLIMIAVSIFMFYKASGVGKSTKLPTEYMRGAI